jgi:hypothetical protein
LTSARKVYSYRFVVVFRREAREIAGAAEVWRGWVERIPAPDESGPAEAGSNRLGFCDLAELPESILTLIDRSRSGDEATSDGRPRE